MNYAGYDIETDGLLMDATVIWCIVIEDYQTDEVFRYRPHQILEAIAKLKTYDRLVGHNERMFDRKVIQKLHPKEAVGLPPSVDTLLISRVWFPDMYTNPVGAHSLNAWGTFLGCPKGDHSDWSEFSEVMLEYCVNDVFVQRKVFDFLMPCARKIPRAVRLEHKVADIIADQIIKGVGVDAEAIRTLLGKTSAETCRIANKLQECFPARFEDMKMPQYWSCLTESGYHREPTKGALVKWIKANPFDSPEAPMRGPVKQKRIEFNPNSDQMLAERLKEKYDWKPKDKTDSGLVSTSDDVLKHLTKWEEVRLIREYRIVKDRTEKAMDWETRIRVDTGRLHGGVTTNGTVTGRMSHSQPNLAQVPKVGKPWGAECRACFGAPSGKVFVGADASGIELRMFAHYVAQWDEGAYAKLLLESDIHTHNQHLAGLPTRDNAKTFIYGLFYGAGDAKLGKITNGSRAAGLVLRNKFMEGLPAYKHLTTWIEFHRQKYGCLIGLDGRRLPVRSSHMALNTLLQSAGALVMKQALVILDEAITENGWRTSFVLNIHDEFQMECHPDDAEAVGTAACESFRLAGEHFGLACPLAGEYKVGKTWKDTH